MIYLDHIQFDLKGISAEYDLARRQVFMGQNRQGKTTIRDAIELATRGRHTVGINPNDVLELFGPEQESIFVTVSGRRGGATSAESWRAKYSQELEGRKPGDPSWRYKGIDAAELKSVLPVFGNQLKGDRLAREAIFSKFGPDVVKAPKGLSTSQRKLWLDAKADLGELSPAQILSALSAHFRALKMSLGREIKSGERGLEALRERVEDGAGAEEIPALERRLEALPDEEENTTIIEGLAVAAGKARTEIDTIEAKIKRAEKIINSSVCPSCKRPAPVELTKRAGKAIPKRQEELKKLRTELAAIERRLGDLNEHEHERSSLTSRLADLREASGDSRSIDAETERVKDLQQEQLDIKFLEKQASKVMTDMMGEVKSNAEGALRSAMIPGFAALLLFTEKKCAWTILDESHTPRRRLASGSEFAALMIGLTVAWGARVLFLDDTDIGTITCNNLTHLCKMLDKAIDDGIIDQAILIIDPDREGRIPGAGWSITEIG